MKIYALVNDRPRPIKEKITPSESRNDIFRVLKKPSECRIGLLNVSKNDFLILNCGFWGPYAPFAAMMRPVSF